MALFELCGTTLEKYGKNEDASTAELLEMMQGRSINPMNLMMPPFPDPAERLKSLNDADAGINIQFNHGTTTLAFKYQGGVVLAVDSRATGGMFIGSNEVKKIIPINKFMVGTMAGGAADCVYWERYLSMMCRIYELRNKERISLAAASKLLSNILYNYKGMGLSLGVMICGYDKTGPGIYYVDNDGTRTAGNLFSVGSGSMYAYGVLDSGYRHDLTDEEAYELGRRAIYHATFRDSASGGIVRVVHIKETGYDWISNNDCTDLHYNYKEGTAAAN